MSKGGAHGATGPAIAESSRKWDSPPFVPPVEEEGHKCMRECGEWKEGDGKGATGVRVDGGCGDTAEEGQDRSQDQREKGERQKGGP